MFLFHSVMFFFILCLSYQAVHLQLISALISAADPFSYNIKYFLQKPSIYILTSPYGYYGWPGF